MGALCKILAKGAKEGLAEPETWQKIVTLVQQMNRSLPAPVRVSHHASSAVPYVFRWTCCAAVLHCSSCPALLTRRMCLRRQCRASSAS